MKKQILLIFLFAFLLHSGKTFSQSWLPEPVKSPYLNAMLGTWTSAPYIFMGKTNNETVTYGMILNGQFLEINFKSTDGKGFTFEGKEILIPSSDGSMKGTYYDILGKEKNSSYAGSMDGNKIILTSVSIVGTGTREIIIDGDTMIQNVTFVMEDKSGNKMPEQKITITYSKTN